MRGYLFQNRWFSLGFAGLVVLGAVSLVGSEDDEGLLPASVSTIAGQQDDMAAEVERLSTPKRNPPIVINQPDFDDFASDEELIDDAAGFDPEPLVGSEPDRGREPGEVVIIRDRDENGEDATYLIDGGEEQHH